MRFVLLKLQYPKKRITAKSTTKVMLAVAAR